VYRPLKCGLIACTCNFVCRPPASSNAEWIRCRPSPNERYNLSRVNLFARNSYYDTPLPLLLDHPILVALVAARVPRRRTCFIFGGIATQGSIPLRIQKSVIWGGGGVCQDYFWKIFLMRANYIFSEKFTLFS